LSLRIYNDSQLSRCLMVI